MDDVIYKKHPVPVISKDNLRRVKKPLIEKKRRARINTCLDELKRLVLQAWHKQGSHFSKLEKADILDLTVRYLKSVHDVQLATALSDDHAMQTNYRAGFSDCAHHLVQYLNASSGVTEDVRVRLTGHVASCVHAVNVTQYSLSSAPNLIQIPQQQLIQTQLPAMPPVYAQIGLPNAGFSCQCGSSVSLSHAYKSNCQCSDSCRSSTHIKGLPTDTDFYNLSTVIKRSSSVATCSSDCDSDMSCSPYTDDDCPSVELNVQALSSSQTRHSHSDYHVPTVKQDRSADTYHQQNESMWRPW